MTNENVLDVQEEVIVNEEPEVVEELSDEEKRIQQLLMQERDMHKITTKQKVVKIIVTTLCYLFLTAVAIMILFPFYWMIISSLKTFKEYQAPTPTFFPIERDWANFAEAFDKGNLGMLFINTVFVGVVSTILSLVLTVLSAFAFARLEFKGKKQRI